MPYASLCALRWIIVAIAIPHNYRETPCAGGYEVYGMGYRL